MTRDPRSDQEETRAPSFGAEGGGSHEGGGFETGTQEAPGSSAHEQDVRPGTSLIGILVGQVLGVVAAAAVWGTTGFDREFPVIPLFLLAVVVGALTGGYVGGVMRGRS